MQTALILARLDLNNHVEVDASLVPVEGKVARHMPLPDAPEGAYIIRDARMDGLREKLAKLVKKADKLGIEAPSLDIVETFTVPVIVTFRASSGWCWARTPEVQTFHVVRAPAAPVVLNGWRFAATIEHLGEEGNLIKAAPSFDAALPTQYRTDKPTCNHCGLARRRAETFVLHSAAEGFTRVGRNCLADFIGSQNAEQLVQIAAMAEAVASLLGGPDEDMMGGYGFGRAQAIEPEHYLVRVAQVIEKVGWLSRGAARETNRTSTANMAWDVIFARKPSDDVKELRAVEPTQAHKDDAKNALAWAQTIDKEVAADFLYNIRLISHLPCWDSSRIGLGAAIVMSYQKEQERLKRLEFERKLPSVYMGEVGSKYGGKGKGNLPPVAARVLGVHTFEGDYGLTTIVRMQATKDETSVHDLVWFASGEVQVVVDAKAIQESVEAFNAEAKASGAHHAAQSAEYTAYWEWHGKQEAGAPRTRTDWEASDGAAMRRASLALGAVLVAASKARTAAEENAKDAKRSIKAGDAVWLSGGVKRQEVSKKTQRPETTMTRCALTLRAE